MKTVLMTCGLLMAVTAGPARAQAKGAGGQVGILSNESVSTASPMTLAAETDLFKSIGNGISVALARCSEDKNCDLNRAEVKHLLDTLNQRINILGSRYASSGDKSLAPVLLNYADERDRFVKLLAEANKVLPAPKSNAAGDKGTME